MNEPPGHYGLALTGTPGFFVNEDVYMFTGENGGSIWKEGGRPDLQNEHVYGALEHYQKLTKYLAPGWLSHKYVDNLAAIASGKVACTPTWGRTVGYMEQYSPDIADAEHFKPLDYKPVGPLAQGPAEKHMFTQNDGEHWVVYKQGKHQEEAMEFLKFFFQNDNYIKWCDSVPIHILPIKISLFNSDAYLNHPDRQKWRHWLNTQRQYLENKFVMPLIMNREADAHIPWLMEVANSGILPDMVFDVVSKGKTPQEATKRAEARINELIDQIAPTIKKG
jgi:ABC-type glycerol-3-phosphate transport system substrate-binding protein